MSTPLTLLPGGGGRGGGDAADPAVQLCVFRVGLDEYAVDIMRVEEILPPQPVTPVPRAPAFVEGVLHLRGAILPVVDLRRRLLPAGAPVPQRSRLLVLFLGRRRVAFAVDRVLEVARVRRSELKPAPPMVAPGKEPFVVGVFGKPGALRLLLDVKAFLRAELAGEAGARGPEAPRGGGVR